MTIQTGTVFVAVPGMRWGDGHKATARPAAQWLADVITLLESCPSLLARLPVVANTALIVRGDRIIVTHRATSAGPAAPAREHPLAIDVRLDASLVLPEAAAREAERAALLLTRLAAHLAGTPAWRTYHQRFYERYGLGSLVPVLDMVSDSGIGWPDGYPGTAPAEDARLSARDELLLALAQDAALALPFR